MVHPTPPFPVRLAAARATLADLIHRVGTHGLAAAAALPGLLAAVDQHAAALRDILTDGHRPPSAIGLAGYVQGVRDTAEALGWHRPIEQVVDWPSAHWLQVRLLAVCQLSQAAGYVQ
jgi:hypothetical protein